MSESKTARLLRLIAAHGPIDSTALTAKANGEGANILAKNLAGLLAASIKAGAVVTSRPDKYTVYAMAEPEPVAQASSLPPDDDDAMPPTDPGLLALANRTLGEQLKAAEAELSAALADQKAESDRATALATDLADICRALDVPHAGEAVEAIEHLEKLADAKAAQDFGDLGRYRELLDQIASSLHCDTYEGLVEAVANIGGTRAPAGRLAILTFVDGAGGVLEYLEPYVSAHDAREIILRRINSGGAEHAILVSAIWQAEREIRYGTITAPEIATLRG